MKSTAVDLIYLQATPESKRLAQGKLVEAILPEGLLPVTKSTFIQ